MNMFNRKLQIALLATLLLSLMAVSLHVATHASGDLQTCELCSGHGNPSHALPPSEAQPEPVADIVVAYVEQLGPRTRSPYHAYRQRAPPVTS